MTGHPVVRDAGSLTALVRRILETAGADAANARIVADHLVLASLSGVDTHGVATLESYVLGIEQGTLLPRAKPTIDCDHGLTARIRGHWGFGHVAALVATDLGIEKAKRDGAAIVAIVECGHIGRVGHFVERAAAAGVVALVFTGGYGVAAAKAVPFGGREPVLHTNPIAFAFPGGSEGGPTFDFATTAVAGSKVVRAQRLGAKLPPGSVVDPYGEPSDDPQVVGNGGWYVPFGGHKGYAIMVAAEWLGRIETGADDFASESPAEPLMRHQGVLGIFMRPDLFAEASDTGRRSDETATRIRRAAPTSESGPAVRLPGDGTRAERIRRSEAGIPIDAETWAGLVDLAHRLGVEV